MAEPLFELKGDSLLTGVFPDLDEVGQPVWMDARNVYPNSNMLKPIPGMEEVHEFDEPVRGIGQAFVSPQKRIYVALPTEAYEWHNGAATKIAEGMSDSNHRIETWGTWAIINPAIERPWLWKNAGLAAIMDVPWRWAKHLTKRGPHLLAINTSEYTINGVTGGGPSSFSWCSADQLEEWDITDPALTAGELTLRDLDGEIKAAVKVGNNHAFYSNETLALTQYIAGQFIFGSEPVLSGIGAYGYDSVCAAAERNYGLGPQGPFETNGLSFRYLGPQWVRKFILDNIDPLQADKCCTFYNEILAMVEFRFPTVDGTLCVAWDLVADKPYIFDTPLEHALERSVFDYPIGCAGNKIGYVSKGTQWLGDPVAGFLQSKPTDCGIPYQSKTFSVIQLEGVLTGLILSAQAKQFPKDSGWVALPPAAAARLNYPNTDAEYLSLRLEFESNQGFEISAIRGYGPKTGVAIV